MSQRFVKHFVRPHVGGVDMDGVSGSDHRADKVASGALIAVFSDLAVAMVACMWAFALGQGRCTGLFPS